jgi:hypothetical protein
MMIMKPTKAGVRRTPKGPTRSAIIRAIASSTAIETGQGIAHIERILRDKRSKYRKIALAK